MAKHDPMTKPRESKQPVLGRTARIGVEQIRQVPGSEIAPGDILPTGVVVMTDHNFIDGEVRLEMVGANIHYVDHDETVLVLGTVDRALLDEISVATHISRQR